MSEYTSKRDFTKTSEPSESDQLPDMDRPIFVIQKHDASQLHYDFRIEIDGTLKSWSVPKGPSTDPSEKRMAIPTEDHPLGYAAFEGTIPEDEYGGGTVMLWDRGSYKNLKQNDDGEEISMQQCYKNGRVEIELQGEKIYGGYALVKMTSGNMEGNWLLIKMDDDAADARRKPTSTENESVVSDRDLDEIAEEE